MNRFSHSGHCVPLPTFKLACMLAAATLLTGVWANTAFAQLQTYTPAQAKAEAAAKAKSASAGKAPAISAGQAAKDLANSDPNVRRAALRWYADHGIYRDANVLAPVLNDDDSGNRGLAEMAMWQMWGRTGDAKIDRQYQKAVDVMSKGDLKAAVDAFSALIRLKPDLAEAWNKRATAYFLMGEVDRSLADCDEVIKRNPLHFGALAGYGQLFSQKGEYETAVDYFNRALQVNPNMQGVRINIEALEKLIEKKRRNTT